MYKDIVKNTHIAIQKFIIGRTKLAIIELTKEFEKNNENEEILRALQTLTTEHNGSKFILERLEEKGENENGIAKV